MTRGLGGSGAEVSVNQCNNTAALVLMANVVDNRILNCFEWTSVFFKKRIHLYRFFFKINRYAGHQEEEKYEAQEKKNEPPHDKTNKMTVRPAKTQISLGIRPV